MPSPVCYICRRPMPDGYCASVGCTNTGEHNHIHEECFRGHGPRLQKQRKPILLIAEAAFGFFLVTLFWVLVLAVLLYVPLHFILKKI